VGERAPECQVLVVLGWVQRGPEVLLVQRHDPALAGAHGKWELPGGKLAFGEPPAAAVAREVLEETGYAVTVRALLPYTYSTVWEYPDRRQHVVILVFDCLAGPRQHAPADPRIAAVAWQRPEEIDFAAALPGVKDFVDWWRARAAAGG
jgi:8-oxo-dGTP pyrophosphatase MutT (NUDIX family)